MPEQPHLIDLLLEHLDAAQHQVILIAPFIKRGVLERCLDVIGEGVDVYVYTRWDAAEVAQGVSDPDIITLDRVNGVRLLPTLHAKAYLSDDRALIGSANLTQRALGITPGANVEVLIPASVDSPEVAALLLEVTTTAKPTNVNYADAVREQAQTLTSQTDIDQPTNPFYPTCRDTTRVLALYHGSTSPHPGDVDAEADLLRLNLPRGLQDHEVRELIASRLRHHPDLTQLYTAGSVNSATLQASAVAHLGITHAEARRRVDTLVRWLQALDPDVRTQPATYDLLLGREFG